MTVQSPPPPAAPAPKKGMGPLGWVAIGCGAIIIIGGIVMAGGAYLFKTKVVDPFKNNPALAAAKLVVQANPDLELVSEDDKAQTLTVHNKKTNETVTVNLEDAKNGNFKFSSDGKNTGTVDIGKGGVTVKTTDEKGQEATFTTGAGAPKDLPRWVPAYPGAPIEAGFSAKSPESSTQTFSFTTTDAVDRVIAFYQDQLKDNGLTVAQPTTVAVGGQATGGTLTADSPDGKRHVQVLVGAADNKTKATITVVEKP